MATGAILGEIVTGVGVALSAVGLSGGSGPYRPSYWSSGHLTSITVPGVTSSVSTSQAVAGTGSAVPGAAGTTTQTSSSTVYVFDGIGRRQHNHRATPTRLPTQTGNAATDHIIIEPIKLVLEVLMSDSMDSYTKGQWAGAPSKSISAFQILDQMRLDRQLLTITTRLMSYSNMVLTDIDAIDDAETQFGLRALVTFDQIIIGSVNSQEALPVRPQLTGSTSQGQIGVGVVPSSVLNNNSVTQSSSVPGAGIFSSNPAGS